MNYKNQLTNCTQSKRRPPLWTPLYIRLGIATVILSFVEQMITTNMAVYMSDIGATATATGVVMMTYTAASMVVRFLAGPWMDRYGRLKVAIVGMYLSIVPIFCFPFFPIVGVVIFLRFLQGVGFSCVSLSQGTMSADIPCPERMDEGVGYYGFFFSIATAFGPATGLAIAQKLGYKALFLSCGVLFIFEIIITYSLNYEKKRGIVYKKASLEAKKLPLSSRVIEKATIPASIVCFFICIAYCVVTSYMAVYTRQIGVEGTGFFFTVVAVATFFGRLISGRWIAKQNRVKALLLGIVGLTIGMFLLTIMTETWQMLLGGLIFGLGAGYVWPALAILAIADVKPNRRGTANATYYASYDFGFSIGGLLGGIIADYMGYRILCMLSVFVFIAAAAITVYIFRDKLKWEIHKEQIT